VAVLLLAMALSVAVLHPYKESHTDAAADGLACEPLTFATSTGARLAGWFLANPESHGHTVVLLHGVCSNKSRFVHKGLELQQRGFNVLLLDQRGHGESSRAWTTYGAHEARDVADVVEQLCRRPDVGSDGVVLVGHSMGAAVALLSLPHPQVRAVVADSPFASLQDMLVHRSRQFHLPSWPLLSLCRLAMRWLARVEVRDVEPQRALRDTAKPVFLVHGTADRSVPHSHSVAMAEDAPHARLWSIPDTGHLDAWQASGYFDLVASFARNALLSPAA
jgi:pimeloyl-ACP methyl ester carboxylesterase